ncbi:hypothetical protein RSAG8_09970, partial [Rhizoctonia solani AG-8 WAC10335]
MTRESRERPFWVLRLVLAHIHCAASSRRRILHSHLKPVLPHPPLRKVLRSGLGHPPTSHTRDRALPVHPRRSGSRRLSRPSSDN